MAERVEIRAAIRDDTPFLVQLACEAYRDVVTRQFGGWNEQEQAARIAAKVARLHTLRRNRTLRLFKRHGFRVTAQGEVFIDLERAG